PRPSAMHQPVWPRLSAGSAGLRRPWPRSSWPRRRGFSPPSPARMSRPRNSAPAGWSWWTIGGVIGQDPAATHRRSRAAGILINDRHGHERGGFCTMDDGSAVLAMDAPRGVGASMPDRLGLVVNPDGSRSEEHTSELQ